MRRGILFPSLHLAALAVPGRRPAAGQAGHPPTPLRPPLQVMGAHRDTPHMLHSCYSPAATQFSAKVNGCETKQKARAPCTGTGSNRLPYDTKFCQLKLGQLDILSPGKKTDAGGDNTLPHEDGTTTKTTPGHTQPTTNTFTTSSRPYAGHQFHGASKTIVCSLYTLQTTGMMCQRTGTRAGPRPLTHTT